MHTRRLLFMLATLCALNATVASAHPVTSRIDRREARQYSRIERGVKSGALTRAEAAMLRAGEARIRHMERLAKADGVVTIRERVRLNRALDRQSRRITRFEHNPRVL